MKRSRLTEEQMIAILKESEAAARVRSFSLSATLSLATVSLRSPSLRGRADRRVGVRP